MSKWDNETGPLGQGIGRTLSGKYCAADQAFSTLEHDARRLERHPAWEWFCQKVHELELVCPFDPELLDLIEGQGSYFGPKENVDRYLQMIDNCVDLEDLASAVFITLQTRLAAVRSGSAEVYKRAKDEDGLSLTIPKDLLPREFWNIWHVANYAKHRDDWKGELNGDQVRTFEVLKRLGVVANEHNPAERFRHPWVVMDCARRITGELTLSAALRAAIDIARSLTREVLVRVQDDFRPLLPRIVELRLANTSKNGSLNTARILDENGDDASG